MGLVIFQFAVSIGLGISAIVVFTQLRYAEQVNLGFNRTHIIVVSNVSALPKSEREDFARAVANESSISGTALSRTTPFDGNIELAKVRWPGELKPKVFQVWDAGFRYFNLYRLKLLAGRFLSAAHANDTEPSNDAGHFNVLITKEAAHALGYTPRDAIGKTIRLERHPVTIVGVVPDQWVEGPQVHLMPTILMHNSDMRELSVRVREGQAIAEVRKVWHRFAPNTAIEWHFLSGAFAQWFSSDDQIERMLSVFVGIAMFVACLGLYGLAAITTQSRTMEIGIRKALGASTREVLQLLLWQFSIPVLVANVLAWPVAWYYLHGWLEGYAARIWLSPVYFVLAALMTLTIASLTVAAHAFSAARTRPARALRCE
jgi:putative ABC transport system permease protein